MQTVMTPSWLATLKLANLKVIVNYLLLFSAPAASPLKIAGGLGPAVNVTILRQPAGLDQPPAPLHPFVHWSVCKCKCNQSILKH